MYRHLFIILPLFAATACDRNISTLEEVRQTGELVIATRNGATTYYIGPDGPTGFEYDLASAFAEELDVDLKIVVPDNFAEILPMVSRGDVHLAAAGLTITDERRKSVRFGPSYQSITPQLVHRVNVEAPEDLSDLHGILEVVRGSSHEERLQQLKEEKYPELSWRTNGHMDSEELLYLVWEQLIDYTIADSNEVAVNRRFYPELRVAFDISDPEPLAWAFPRGEDHSLFDAAKDFFFRIKENGKLDQIQERYYGHVEDFDYVGTIRYMQHIEQRLPEFIELFKLAAEEHDLDWRLLAAIGYQESHWQPRARSPTGVRGIMMLTLNTMKHLGLNNRLDPKQSIFGGARYFRMMKEKIPDRIEDPDRTWLALASYNVGFGHLEDARILTESNGANPDRWVDVKRHLPLLSQKKWYTKTRYGYARGREPVRYVENIRSYYDILVWHTERGEEPEVDPPGWLRELPSL